MTARNGDRPAISVVIPTCGRPFLLDRCLGALLRQSLSGRSYEIVVVEDGEGDDGGTLAVCDERRIQSLASDGPAIQHLQTGRRRGPAAARNLGWRAARGELIAFTDDDTIPDPDWLREAQAAMQPAHRVAVWGRVDVPLPDRLTDHALNTAGLQNAVFVTANAIVRRSALQAVGGFDERYRRAWREDSDLYFALLSAWPGEDAIAPAPRARVLHPVRDARFLISIGQQANIAFDALLFKKYPSLYDERIGFRRPPPEYTSIVAATVAALAVWPLSGAAAAGALALAVVLIARLARRRLKGLARTPANVVEMLVSSAVIPFVSLYWRLAGALRWRVAFF
ncbi:MAG TPA: glycosyltransferase [Burkholderiaceae bacterium]|nr:glycosyltransferase [Burkholderiaceae bacterium]